MTKYEDRLHPTPYNTHGSMANRKNPRTGRTMRWETMELAKYAEEDARKAAEKEKRELQKAFDEELALLERQQLALQARDDLLTYTKFTMPDPERSSDPHATLYDAQRFHVEVAKAMEAVERGEIQQMIFCMPPRHGKSIAHDQPILTPSGWRQHGDIEAGDFVFGPDGEPTKVLDVSQEVAEVVPVELTNGEVIYAHLNHEWRVYDRSAKDWRVMETRALAKRTLRSGPEGRGGRFVLQLPDAAALQFPEVDLPLHPYVLGVWLGDGTSNSTRIAHHADDVAPVNEIEALGYPVSGRRVHGTTGVVYTEFAGPRPGVGSPMQKALRALGVLGNKHIPESYLRGSVAQRLELLAGLIDTDGHVERSTGRVRFITCSEALRDGVYDLATTLGFRPYVNATAPALSSSGIQGRQTVYHVGFQPNLQIPTRLPRKQITKFAARRRIGIKSVGEITFKRARSISVERADGLYVVGRQCVVTKNTELATKRFSAWLSGKHPEWNIAVGTYADSLANDIGADVRNIMKTPQHRQVFPDHELRRGGNRMDNMQTTRNGRLVFVGRGTGLTGKGAHALLIDDILKDNEEARSQAIRDQAWNWFTKVAMTRRMGKKLVVITMTRWHSDDIVGRLTDPENPHYNSIEAKKWKIIRLPALAEDDDPLGREPGEPLWPDAFDEDFLQSQQRIDPLGFAALYQQTPTVADGTLFQRDTIQRYEPNQLPETLRYYATSDHAVGTKQRNDPSCFLKGGVDAQGNLWLTDIFWQRVPADRAVAMMLEMGAGGEAATRPLVWWAERGHISKSIGPFLQKRMQEEGRFLRVQEVTPVGDKEQRAQSISARVALGKVYFPKGAIWDKAIEEMMAFPNGLHDDFVDALSLFGLGLTSQFGISKPEQKKEPRFGTWAWVKQDQERQERRAKPAYGGF